MSRVLTRLRLGGLIVLMAAFAVGCGGGDDSTSGEGASASTEPEPVTQADFDEAADSACRSKTDDIAKALTESEKAQADAVSKETLASEDAVKAAASKVGDTIAELADLKNEVTRQLAALDTPDPDALQGLVKAREESAEDLEALADAWRSYGKNPTQKTVDEVSAAQEVNEKSAFSDQKVSEEMGLKVCGAPIELK